MIRASAHFAEVPWSRGKQLSLHFTYWVTFPGQVISLFLLPAGTWALCCSRWPSATASTRSSTTSTRAGTRSSSPASTDSSSCLVRVWQNQPVVWRKVSVVLFLLVDLHQIFTLAFLLVARGQAWSPSHCWFEPDLTISSCFCELSPFLCKCKDSRS